MSGSGEHAGFRRAQTAEVAVQTGGTTATAGKKALKLPLNADVHCSAHHCLLRLHCSHGRRRSPPPRRRRPTLPRPARRSCPWGHSPGPFGSRGGPKRRCTAARSSGLLAGVAGLHRSRSPMVRRCSLVRCTDGSWRCSIGSRAPTRVGSYCTAMAGLRQSRAPVGSMGVHSGRVEVHATCRSGQDLDATQQPRTSRRHR